ncbi:ORF6C domain-containing protein [Inconstantimicrobium mannanitabidum]|uniref:Antirepressor n=1 Tax=Inconstantimicrobium mannanitabidum TaxID=1604901 RepID=A0ACB5R8U2_9CLOT|nr:ORF6C domain-containing protein [Clostridium sp. TW13]GKX65609.1 antirepressor [Clostridium sp. TW13]
MEKLENKLSSREVAGMMEMDHKHLLRKIEGINEDLTKSKIGLSKYWVEGTYKDTSGKSNKEYQITKRGCEFLAHKTTGTKGNLFTDKYMDKFAVMEQQLQQPQKQLAPLELLRLQYAAIEEQEKKLGNIENKMDHLENNIPLFNVECKELQALVKKVATRELGGYKSQAYNEKWLRSKVYSDLQQQLRREFGVSRYEAIKRSQLNRACEIVKAYKAPLVLQEEITLLNSQVTI